LLRAGNRRVREVWVASGLEPSPQLSEIERLAVSRRVRLVEVGRRRLESVARTESAQGVLAFANPLRERTLDELCEGAGRTRPFLVVLDGVSDPQNLGALLRVAECAGTTGLVLPKHRAAHVTPAVTKVAAGAIEHLPIAVVSGVPNTLRLLSRRGVYTIGLDSAADTSIYEVGEELEGPVALVLGAEGQGLGRLVQRRCDTVASIPQHGAIGSLNVAAAGAVACFEVARRRGSKGGSGASCA
jgi:23S rRNA (guanosine2251-2'-O)-methyltransferase